MMGPHRKVNWRRRGAYEGAGQDDDANRLSDRGRQKTERGPRPRGTKLGPSARVFHRHDHRPCLQLAGRALGDRRAPRTITRAPSKPPRERSEAFRLRAQRPPPTSIESEIWTRDPPGLIPAPSRACATIANPGRTQQRRGEPAASERPSPPKSPTPVHKRAVQAQRRVLAHADLRLPEFSHGSQLDAQCPGRDHRRDHDLRRRLSGERRVRALGVSALHHRAGLAFAVLAAGPDAGAPRARRHDDLDRRRLYRLRLARRMGIWPRRHYPLLADTARYQAIYERAIDWLDDRGISVAGLWSAALQRRLAPALGEPDHRPRQYDSQLLADRASLRHLRSHGSRRPAPTRPGLSSNPKPLGSSCRAARRRRSRSASIWKCAR